MKHRLALLALVPAVVAAVGGCAAASQGRKFDDSYVSQIRKGSTTKAQIRQAFGEPQSATRSSDIETWVYSYNNAYGRAYVQGATWGLVREKSDDQMLMVAFKGDVVVEYSYTK